MHWLLDPIKNDYVNFSGRVTRQTYWMFVLWTVGIQMVLSTVGLDMLSSLAALILFLPSLGLAARRLHDTNRSGWWQLLWLIPVIGWILLIVFLAQESYPTDNPYGSNPKMKGTSPTSAPVQTPTTPETM